MARAIIGVIAGYLIMVVVVFATFTGAYLGMGAERAFEPGSYDVSMMWIVASTVLGLVAAVVGGIVCASIAERGSKAPMVLAAVVLVLGLVLAVPVLMAEEAEPPATRTGDVNNLEAMSSAKQPTWMALVNPLIGFVGVLVGARMRGKGKAVPTPSG